MKTPTPTGGQVEDALEASHQALIEALERLDAAEIKNAALREEVERLENERAELWRQKRECLSDRDTLNAACGSLRDELTAERASVADRAAELARVRDENKDLDDRLLEASNELVKLEDQLSTLRATNAELVKTVEAAGRWLTKQTDDPREALNYIRNAEAVILAALDAANRQSGRSEPKCERCNDTGLYTAFSANGGAMPDTDCNCGATDAAKGGENE